MEDFEGLYNLIKKKSIDDFLVISEFRRLIKQGTFKNISDNTIVEFDVDKCRDICMNTFVGCFKNQFEGGATIYDAIIDMKKNVEDYKFMYSILEDDLSKETLVQIMYYRFFADYDLLNDTYYAQMQYFRPELLSNRDDSVLVDCGSFNGNNIKEFIDVYGAFKEAYTYEPVPHNYANIVENLKGYSNVTNRNAGVAEKKGSLKFTSHLPDSANRINPLGDYIVDIVSLDEDIREKVTFIKMDIEGAEESAILGAKKHIINDKPELAICIYHTVADLWNIFKTIYGYNPNQRFNIRHHRNDRPEEIVLYCSPQIKEAEDSKSKLEGLEHFNRLLELTESVYEGLDFAKTMYINGQLSSSVNMLTDVKCALELMVEDVNNIEIR